GQADRRAGVEAGGGDSGGPPRDARPGDGRRHPQAAGTRVGTVARTADRAPGDAAGRSGGPPVAVQPVHVLAVPAPDRPSVAGAPAADVPVAALGPNPVAQRSLRIFWVISRSQTLHHFQRSEPTDSSRWALAMLMVRNQILVSPPPAFSSLAQRAKCSMFVPALTAGRFPLDPSPGTEPWKTKPTP